MAILGNILTAISYIIFWTSRFCKNKKKILIVDNISRLITILSFLCLKNLNGIQNTFFVLIRNELGHRVKNKKKYIAFFIMLAILFFMYYLSFEFPSTIFIAVCGITNLIGVILCETKWLRIWGMIGSIPYILFQLSIKNYAGTICEFITLIIMLYTFFTIEIKRKESKI